MEQKPQLVGISEFILLVFLLPAALLSPGLRDLTSPLFKAAIYKTPKKDKPLKEKSLPKKSEKFSDEDGPQDERTDDQTLVVSISKDGLVTILGKKMDNEKLITLFKELNGKNCKIHLQADKDTEFKKVLNVLDIAKEHGNITSITFTPTDTKRIKQDDLDNIKKEIMEKIEARLKEEMNRMLKEMEKIVDEKLKKLSKPDTTPKEKRGYLGIRPGDLSEEEQDELGTKGSIIKELIPDTPADKAGLEIDDVITEADGKKIESSSDIIKLVQSKKAGDELKITVQREKEKKEFTIKLGVFPDDE